LITITRATPLNDALGRLGYRTETTLYPVQKLLCGDLVLFEGTNSQIWKWLLMTGQVALAGNEPQR
jgi:hypothetical protein